MIDFHDEYSASIKSIAIEKSSKINLTARFLNGKMLMFSKVSVKSYLKSEKSRSQFVNHKLDNTEKIKYRMKGRQRIFYKKS